MNLLITGVSSGLGAAFAAAALDAGHTVVGTVRRPVEGFRGHQRILDVTDDDAVRATVDEVERSVGPIDAVIANAGYGHEGVLEESPLDEMRAQFAVNVFGAVATIQAVLPHMRRRRRGRILAVTSMGGLLTVPGLAYYNASKHALEGILGTLRQEVAQFGIHVTAVAPGSFRTDWSGRSMVRSPRSIADYDDLMNPTRARRQAASGNQLGDPAKAAAAVLRILETPDPPAHLLLGSDALRLVTAARKSADDEFAAWADLTRSTDFPSGAQL